ncbi:NAD(P)-dependent alcohol dehydrogenase [Agromyces sp. GXQ0307]|uniref:NAD(P)-dependent alcohol dehydrogenase n=1 Tax=Agromyces sp. GXQ0307 TaxID=3377835 RepID=UPI00383A6CD9
MQAQTATTTTTTRTDATGADHVAPATMTAVVQRAYGDVEVLDLDRIDVPRPAAGQVLLEVRAAGLDRGTWHLMTGLPYLTRLMFGLRRPTQPVPGFDVAGVVVAVGEGVDRFAVGDEVFGIADGSFAEYAVAEASTLARKPRSVSFDEAAVVPVSGLTAHQAVHGSGRVAAGQRVLVIGASGGVGGYAVQLATRAGAEVTGVASAAKAEHVRSLGAVRVIDYRTTDVSRGSERYDLIVDINGRLPVRRLQRILTPTGTLVIVGGEGGGRLTGGLQRQLGAPLRSLFTRKRLTFFISSHEQDAIGRLADLLAEGDLTATVGRTYPLADVRGAMRDLVAGSIAGKAVIRVGR